MEMPKGEGLYLTIDRVVERGCHECAGQGGFEIETTCYVTRDMAMDAGDMSYEGSPIAGPIERQECERCHGTGRLKVRVRGWVPVKYDNGHWTVIQWGNKRKSLYNHGLYGFIIAAYLDGTLPDELAAHITKEDCDDR